MTNSSTAPQTHDRPLLSILFNILIPVAILNQLGKRLGENGPLIALIVAVAFPLGYGVIDLWVRRHKNYVSLLGLVSVLITGGFALLHLEGDWFAWKEAAFPLLIGVAVFVSAHTKKPLVATLFCNDQVLNVALIEQRLQEKASVNSYDVLTRKATKWFASSFLLSAAANFLVAKRVFTPIDVSLTAAAHSEVLNNQIAKMTGLSFLLIALPMMVISSLVLFWFLKQLAQLTELKIDELMKS